MDRRSLGARDVMKRTAIAAAAACALWGSTAQAEVVAGRADVLDGDSLSVAGLRIRLLDIDAPESGQLCFRKGESVEQGAWSCGQQAAAALSAWIGEQKVTCDTTGQSARKSWFARCTVNGKDVAQWLAANGWAVPFQSCACETVRSAAKGARSAGLGIWSGAFTMPWEWRAER